MNIQLANVIADVAGETGQRFLRAFVAGERDGVAPCPESTPWMRLTSVVLKLPECDTQIQVQLRAPEARAPVRGLKRCDVCLHWPS